MKPKITIDRAGRVVYVELSASQASKANEIVFTDATIIVHLDKLDSVVGIEILYDRPSAKMAEIRDILGLANLVKEAGRA